MIQFNYLWQNILTPQIDLDRACIKSIDCTDGDSDHPRLIMMVREVKRMRSRIVDSDCLTSIEVMKTIYYEDNQFRQQIHVVRQQMKTMKFRRQLNNNKLFMEFFLICS